MIMEASAPISATVVMPVYNGGAFLNEALKSVLEQAGLDSIEILALDDGSKDDSYKILTGYDDPRLTVIRHPNMGLAATLNKGLSLARGKYIARQDQDDLMLPGRLAKQLAFLESNPDIAMVGTWAEIRVGDEPSGRFHRHPCVNDAIKLHLLFDNPFVHSSIMMRKDVALKLGGYCEDKRRQPPEDYEFWSRIARENRVANLPDVLTVYRETPASMSRTGVNPFLPNVLTIAAENLYAVLAQHWTFEDCLSLAYLYHSVVGAPRVLNQREALKMITMAAEVIGGERKMWSNEMAIAVIHLERHINSRFLRRNVPPQLLNIVRKLRCRLSSWRNHG
jgi:glycosyltransferase involved in cell wall biosynthesis